MSFEGVSYVTSVAPILTVSLNTFVRYYAMDTSKLVGEINRRMQQSGGYDFYRSLTDAIRAKIRGATEDEIQSILNNSSNLSEVSYNKAAYSIFVSKYGSKRGLAEFDKKGHVKLSNGELVVSVAPTFSVETSTELSVFHIWAAQNPTMDRARASVAVYLMGAAFKRSAPNYSYKLFDAVEGKTYSAMNNATAQAVEIVAKNIVSLAKSS